MDLHAVCRRDFTYEEREIKVSQVWLPLTVVPNSPQARLRMVKPSSPPSFNCFLALSLLGVVLSLHCRGDNRCANENVTSILRSITNSVPIFLSISLLFNLAGLRCKNDTWKSYTLLAGAKP